MVGPGSDLHTHPRFRSAAVLITAVLTLMTLTAPATLIYLIKALVLVLGYDAVAVVQFHGPHRL